MMYVGLNNVGNSVHVHCYLLQFVYVHIHACLNMKACEQLIPRCQLLRHSQCAGSVVAPAS